MAGSICNRLRLRGRTQGREIVRDLLQVRIGLIFEQVIHRRVATPPVAKCHQLVHQIAGRLAGETREIITIRPPALTAVAWFAGAQVRLHRIGCAFRRLRLREGGYAEHYRNE